MRREALAVRRAVLPESTYTSRRVTKGHEVPDALQANLYRNRHADKAMSTDFAVRQARGFALQCCAASEGDACYALAAGVQEKADSRGY